VYGLGCRAGDAAEIERIYVLKSRDRKKPLSILVDNLPNKIIFNSFSKNLRRLFINVWPGKVTLVLETTSEIQKWLETSIKESTVGIRISNHFGVREAVRRLSGPIASTSANTSSERDSYAVPGIPEKLRAKVDGILDGGVLPYSRPSTVLNCLQWPPKILREGAVLKSEIQRIIETCES